MPHYAHQTSPHDFMPRPEPPEPWQTGLRFWVHKEGLIWGCYWTVRSRWLNAVDRAAYAQRLDDWHKDVGGSGRGTDG